MGKQDMIQMFVIIALVRALDDQVLMIEANDLKQLNKVNFKALKQQSNKLFKTMQLGQDEEVLELMSDHIHNSIKDLKTKIDIT
jgi:hypothetical protein